MKYFKNTELAKLYNVSEKSVRNWIQAAQDAKLDLQLYEMNSKFFVANTMKNTMLIQHLAEKGKKFKNKRGFRVITPTEKFYQTYSTSQIYDLASSLAIHRELPLKYSYADGGADYWDRYTVRLASEQSPNMLTSTIDLLSANLDDIDTLINDHKSVNIIDLGPGNGYPVKTLLAHLSAQDKLNRYIALDVSKEMIEIARRNIDEWFDGKIQFEGYIRDFSHERFRDLSIRDYSSSMDETPINIVLLLGGTLCNLRSQEQALQAINNSMSINDILIYNSKLDTPSSRRFFDFNISSHNEGLTPRHRLALDLLNIDPSLYEVEQKFDDQQSARFITIKFKIAVQLAINIGEGQVDINFNKDDTILLWRYWHQDTMSILNQFNDNDFDLLNLAKTSDQEYLLSMSKVKSAY